MTIVALMILLALAFGEDALAFIDSQRESQGKEGDGPITCGIADPEVCSTEPDTPGEERREQSGIHRTGDGIPAVASGDA